MGKVSELLFSFEREIFQKEKYRKDTYRHGHPSTSPGYTGEVGSMP